jgi:DNA-binding NarL/FixJ family response regulator
MLNSCYASIYAGVHLQKISIMPKAAPLTELETKIIKLICKQLTSHEIAAKLKYSPRTIETIRRDILKKTKSKNGIGVFIYALKQGLAKL